MDSSVAEPVADAANREDVFGLARVALELLAQVADVDVDRARFAVVRTAPERLQQHPAAVDTARMCGQGPQQLELDVGQLHGLLPDLDGAPSHVDPETVEGDHLFLLRARRVARCGASA